MAPRPDRQQWAAAHRQLLRIPACPYTPTPAQARFLMCLEREALYGGAAGGGKSVALLMAALQFVGISGYSALIFRTTRSDLRPVRTFVLSILGS